MQESYWQDVVHPSPLQHVREFLFPFCSPKNNGGECGYPGTAPVEALIKPVVTVASQ